MTKPRNGTQRTRYPQNTTGPSLTKQSFRDESNMNIILAKYAKTGLLEHVKQYEGHYDNVLGAEDYHTSMNRILEADAAFASLPSGIRSKFHNDPGEFLEFATEPKNREEMYELGLANRPDTSHAEHLKDGKAVEDSKAVESPPKAEK